MSKFRRDITNGFKFRLFKLTQLPLAYFAGLKVKKLNDNEAIISIKHTHWTKNPFRSMYFAAQAMAAELSTGVLVMERVEMAKPNRISMLVYNMKAEFLKKATGTIEFTCNDGHQLDAVFDYILNTDDGKIIELESIGRDQNGDIVSKFMFTWTLKEKK